MEKLAAFNTMIALKKKMHNMKQDKENAFDQADQLEQKLVEHRSISEKVPSLQIIHPRFITCSNISSKVQTAPFS